MFPYRYRSSRDLVFSTKINTGKPPSSDELIIISNYLTVEGPTCSRRHIWERPYLCSEIQFFNSSTNNNDRLFFVFSKSHWEFCGMIGFRNSADHPVGFEPRTFLPSCNSLMIEQLSIAFYR